MIPGKLSVRTLSDDRFASKTGPMHRGRGAAFVVVEQNSHRNIRSVTSFGEIEERSSPVRPDEARELVTENGERPKTEPKTDSQPYNPPLIM